MRLPNFNSHLYDFIILEKTVFKIQSSANFLSFFQLPLLVYAVSPLVEGQRFDLVLACLTCLRLQSWGNIRLQGSILPLNGPHL